MVRALYCQISQQTAIDLLQADLTLYGVSAIFLECLTSRSNPLHKSKSGIKTPTEDLELIRRRLKAAEDDYKIQLGKGEAL